MKDSFENRHSDFFLYVFFVILFTLMFLVAILVPMSLSLSKSRSTAYADSSNGIVEDNILLNTEFHNDDYLIKNSNNTSIQSYNPLRFSSSGAWGYIVERHPLSFYDTTRTITFTVRIRSVDGHTVLIGGRLYNSAGNTVQSLSTRYTNSTSFVNLSITYDLSSYSLNDIYTLGFCYYCNNADSNGLNAYCEVEWSKVEYGSSFTGYVPNDYENYGYNQGVNSVFDNSNGIVNNNYITTNFDSAFSDSAVALNGWFGNMYFVNVPYNYDSTNNVGLFSRGLMYIDVGDFDFSQEYTFVLSFARYYSGDNSYYGERMTQSNNLLYRSTNAVSSVAVVYNSNLTIGGRTSNFVGIQFVSLNFIGVYFAKLEYGPSFTGYVPRTYENYGYNQGIGNMLDYVDNNSVQTKLDVSQYINTGLFNFSLNSSANVLVSQSFKQEFVVPDGSLSTPYNPLNLNEKYQVIWGSGSSSNTAGYYGVRASLNSVNGLYSKIPANTTFFINVNDYKIVSQSGDTWSSNNLNGVFIIFYTNNNEIIVYDENFSGLNYISNPCDYSSSTPCKAGTTLYKYYSGVFSLSDINAQNIGLTSGYTVCSRLTTTSENGTMYFNLPYDVYSIGIVSYLDTSYRYFAYDMTVGFLPSNDYLEGYRIGYQYGQKVGKQQGINEGWQQAKDFATDDNGNPKDYTFVGLFTSIVDSPISALRKFLDFEVLGYNLSNFVFSIITIGIILLIVKKFV